MQSVEEIFQAQVEVKKSNFIAFLVPIDKFASTRNELIKAHPKANHVVWARRKLNEFNQIQEQSSDDGEPKGTSGPPILNVLRGADLIECGILVVRYFGGIKLGTGGLVRAYGVSANEVINNANLIPFEQKESLNFRVPYHFVQRIEHFFQSQNIEFGKRDYDENGVIWTQELTKKQKLDFLDFAKEFFHQGLEIDS